MLHRIGLTHTFDAAHRVVGHEGGKGKCARLHGHTYTVDVAIDAPAVDATGFVVDFGEIKRLIDKWDHRTLLWEQDPMTVDHPPRALSHDALEAVDIGIVRLEFNPTAENMALHLARELYLLVAQADAQVAVTVRETAKSAAACTYPSTRMGT